MTGLERALADLARGDARKARDRLLGLVVTFPHDREIRRLLAEAYRRDRQPTEAGRWGYLVGEAASEQERAAFERHCAFVGSRITEARLRRLLRTTDIATIADDFGRARLATLPKRRRADRDDTRFEALRRSWAGRRASRRWRRSG